MKKISFEKVNNQTLFEMETENNNNNGKESKESLENEMNNLQINPKKRKIDFFSEEFQLKKKH